MLEGLMQDDFPLTLQHPLHRMRSVHPGAQVSTLTDAVPSRPASARSPSESTG